MKVGIIGVGLIGGSFALVLKEHGIASKTVGYDTNENHSSTAKENGIVDETSSLDDIITTADLIILALPVNGIINILGKVLDKIKAGAIVIDAGSTKERIIEEIKNHKNRKQFVATHPMWGTEYSGPLAARKDAFKGKATVICDREDSDPKAVEKIADIYEKIGMHIIYMNGKEHDVHVAYISHISHITSFALANTVLEKEREEDAIFELASAGFESTVRLANSNPATWASIFMQNKENVLDVLNEHISQLRKFKSSLEKDNIEYLKELIVNANKIKRIIK
ncbi:MAG: prephenate dehydrogenase [Ginsengibacter sp.]